MRGGDGRKEGNGFGVKKSDLCEFFFCFRRGLGRGNGLAGTSGPKYSKRRAFRYVGVSTWTKNIF